MIEEKLLEALATANSLYPGSTEQYFAVTYDSNPDQRDIIRELTPDIDQVISAYTDLEQQGRSPRLYVTHVVMTPWEEYNPGLEYVDDADVDENAVEADETFVQLS